MEKLTQQEEFITNEEFTTIFTTILDIRMLREKVKSENREIKINNQDFKEFEVFVNIYIHLKSRGESNEDQRGMFSLGVISLKNKFAEKLIKNLEEKLKKYYKNCSVQDRQKVIDKIMQYLKNSDITDLEKYINFEEITQEIKKKALKE